jgi:hypothetical protein
MENNLPAIAISKKALWTGYVMSILPVLLLLLSVVMKFAKPPAVLEGFTHLGWPEGSIVRLGILELACTAAYLIPVTSILGAILLTGYLGGATAVSFRVGDSFIPTVILGVLLWGGLFLREPRLRALIPFKK